MRVLLIDQFAEIGGAQLGLLEAAEGFSARGWNLEAVIPEGPLAAKLHATGVHVTTIPCGPFHSVRKSLGDAARFAIQCRHQWRTISSVIARQGTDVLYVNGPRLLPAAAMASRNCPLVFHSHSILPQPSAAWIAGRALQHSQATAVASSQFVLSWLQPHVPPGQSHVIYNGIRARRRTAPRPRFTRIGMLARIAPEKGQLHFVRAARIASETNPDLRFLIAGAPVFSSRQYFDTVRAEAGPNVEFSGWTEDLDRFFEQIDILAVPSDPTDANPRVIPEAYSAGVPVIAFASGGVPELLQHNLTGILVEEHTSRALAAAISAAVRNPAALEQMADNGFHRWSTRYTLPRFQSELCAVLESAARGRERANVRASATAW